jgi:anti-sigma factor RsiW
VNDDAHRAVRELLGAYALDQLDQHARLGIDAHLAGCPSCRAELEEIAPVAASLRLVDPDRLAAPLPAPPPELGAAVLARIQAARAARPRRQLPRWAGLAAAAALIAIVAAGIGWWAHPDEARTVAAPLEAVAVSPADSRVEASAQVVPHTWGMEIKLTATGFETGRPYQVAVTDSGGRRVAAGEFIGTGPNEMRCNLTSSVPRAAATGFEVTDLSGTLVLASSF